MGRTWSLVEQRRVQQVFDCSWLLDSHLFWNIATYDTGHMGGDYKWSLEPLLDLLGIMVL
jgi:hypothetical protein